MVSRLLLVSLQGIDRLTSREPLAQSRDLQRDRDFSRFFARFGGVGVRVLRVLTALTGRPRCARCTVYTARYALRAILVRECRE